MLLLSLACSATPLDRAVSRCETELAELSSELLHPQVFESLSEPCRDALALNIGLELDGVPEEDSSAAYLVTGLFVLLADDSRNIGEALEEEGMPEVTRSQLEEVVGLYKLSDQDPVGRAWMAFVAGPILETQLFTDQEYPGGLSLASWGGGVLSVPDVYATWIWSSVGDAPVASSMTLVHEAGHSRAPAHVPCSDVEGDIGCDADAEGTWGGEVWFAQQWSLNHPEFQETAACESLASSGWGGCRKILDEPDWPICRGHICGDE